ncbi:TnpV protein [Enterococcus durans]|uniref:TnpV protein n=2 Tax=Enterococcus TaxID=1350 RepID=UPI0035DF74B4
MLELLSLKCLRKCCNISTRFTKNYKKRRKKIMNTPLLQMSNQKEFDQPLQDYGMIAKEYLKENYPFQYTNLMTEGDLMKYLHNLQECAINQEMNLEQQALKVNPYPNTENSLQLANHLKVIQSQVMEQVILEIQSQIDNP